MELSLTRAPLRRYIGANAQMATAGCRPRRPPPAAALDDGLGARAVGAATVVWLLSVRSSDLRDPWQRARRAESGPLL
jgi:hypothetical protein